MKPRLPSPLALRLRQLHREKIRGSVLLTSMIFAIILALILVSGLKLSLSSLALAHRTYFADVAANLCETALEEAVWSFNKLGARTGSTAITEAWNTAEGAGGGGVWTLGNTVTDVYISSNGTGYTSAPTVTFTGGGGTGAAGTAIISSYHVLILNVDTVFTGVTSLTITNPGSGYTSAPVISFTGGGGTLAGATARLAATRTFTFNNLDQNASGVVKVWVAGYDGTAQLPIVVARATITPFDGPVIEKYIKVVLAKNGALAKGVVAKNGINWNGQPLADSFVSSPTPGTPPFTNYDPLTARPNTVLASLYGPTIDLGAGGAVNGNVMAGPGVTVTGGSVTGQTIGNFTYNFTYPTVPINSGATAGISLGSILPTTLPRAADTVPNADGNFYYYVNGATIGDVTITPGKNVVIVGIGTNMVTGFKVPASGATIGKATIYMDGPINLAGNDNINKIPSPNSSWAGALNIYTSTSSNITMSGNAAFYGSIFAPNAALVGNGGGNSSEDLSGSFVVKSVTSNGHMNFHFDENMKAQAPAKPWSLALWTELQAQADRQLYAAKFSTF